MRIDRAKHGRGVFSTKQYDSGDLIESCHVIVLSKKDTFKIDETLLYDYYFSWGENGNQAAIALGNGSLFNHSYAPNAKYIKDESEQQIRFIAIKNIAKGEEIRVNYNGDPDSKKPLWFSVTPE